MLLRAFASSTMLAFAVVSLAACPPAASKGANHPLLRKMAPPDDVAMQSGGTWKPAQNAGSVVVIDFWATWCPPCKVSVPELQRVAAKHPEVKVVAVNEDADRSKVAPFLKEHGITMPIALDGDQSLAGTYGVDTMPTVFLIDKHGVVRYVHPGYDADEPAKIDAEMSALAAEP